MDYFIIKYSKMRQQEIQQMFEGIHRARMSRPKGVNRRHVKTLRDLNKRSFYTNNTIIGHQIFDNIIILPV